MQYVIVAVHAKRRVCNLCVPVAPRFESQRRRSQNTSKSSGHCCRFFSPHELQPHHQLQPVGYLYLHVKLHRQLNHVAQFSPLGKKV